jgi:two-component system nitrate/nitrite response regulator NarL
VTRGSEILHERCAVLVSESSRMACQLLANALRRSPYRFEVVAECTTLAEVMAAAAEFHPDVAVLSADLQNDLGGNQQVLRQLRTQHPSVRTIVLLNTPDRELIVDAFRCGAKGIFYRAASVSTLCKCVDSVYKGQVWAGSTELQYILEALSAVVPLRLVNAKGANLLTKREEEVVALVAEGMTNREISEKLKISEHTVKNYLFRIFDKLGISSRVELILYALNQRQAA